MKKEVFAKVVKL